MTNQNDISSGIDKNKAINIDEILQEVSNESGFVSDVLIGESRWWNSSEVGAKHYSGLLKGKPAVLKLQLVKIDSPEVEIIESYHKHNKSLYIRAPHIYYHKPWNEVKNYEAIVMEKIDKVPVVNYPSNLKEIESFHFYFNEYKTNTDMSDPWIEKPADRDVEEVIINKYAKWKDMRKKVAKNPNVLTEEDEDLIQRAVLKIASVYKNGVALEFVHGHFGPQDLSYTGKDTAVVFSNLYWSWRYPYYDLVFGFHYFKFFLANTSTITPDIYMNNIQSWHDCMLSTAKKLGHFDERLLNTALLERLAAGLNLDYLNVGGEKPLFPKLLDDTRNSITDLLRKLG